MVQDICIGDGRFFTWKTPFWPAVAVSGLSRFAGSWIEKVRASINAQPKTAEIATDEQIPRGPATSKNCTCSMLQHRNVSSICAEWAF